MLKRRHEPRGASTPTAPRINPCPLPDIGSLLAASTTPIPRPHPATTSASTSHRRHRTDESGYSSSVESSSSPQRTRPISQSVRSPLAPTPPPLKGILKTGMSASRLAAGNYADVIISDNAGSSESSVVFRASLVRQDHRDGYASSPEKPPSLRVSSQSRPSKSKPPVISASAFSFRFRRLTRGFETLNRTPQVPTTAILVHRPLPCTGSFYPSMLSVQRARSSSTLRTRSTRSCSRSRGTLVRGRCPCKSGTSRQQSQASRRW